MRTKWIDKNGKDKCILFMNGWGCDENPMKTLNTNEYDILTCYDYRDILLPKEVNRLFENYAEIHLVAWSLGVYVSNLILNQYKELFSSKIAINGTLSPIDNLKGIRPAVFQGTIDGLNERNLEKFWMRMCGGRSAFNLFKTNKPQRKLDEQKEELITLQKIIQNHFIDWNVFDSVLIGSNDMIFTSDNQNNAWGGVLKIIERDYSHFCFDRWKSWDELIEDLSSGTSGN